MKMMIITRSILVINGKPKISTPEEATFKCLVQHKNKICSFLKSIPVNSSRPLKKNPRQQKVAKHSHIELQRDPNLL